jgi:sulfur-carrier protein
MPIESGAVPTVRIPPVLRPEAGNNRHVEADGATVREVLENLVESYPSLRNRIFEGDDLPQFLNVFIDGTDVRLNEGLETPVNEGATVVLLPAVAGGQSNVATLRAVLDGFNRHDLEAIMSHFADDCVFESPRGPERWGRRFVGKEEVRRIDVRGCDIWTFAENGELARKDSYWKIREE